jgi:hypothetical protein
MGKRFVEGVMYSETYSRCTEAQQSKTRWREGEERRK